MGLSGPKGSRVSTAHSSEELFLAESWEKTMSTRFETFGFWNISSTSQEKQKNWTLKISLITKKRKMLKKWVKESQRKGKHARRHLPWPAPTISPKLLPLWLTYLPVFIMLSQGPRASAATTVPLTISDTYFWAPSTHWGVVSLSWGPVFRKVKWRTLWQGELWNCPPP